MHLPDHSTISVGAFDKIVRLGIRCSLHEKRYSVSTAKSDSGRLNNPTTQGLPILPAFLANTQPLGATITSLHWQLVAPD